jgi:hypothetical protein
MGVQILDKHDPLLKRRTFGFFDDFDWMISPHRWTTVASDSGTITVANGVNGIAPLVASDGTVADNDETYLRSTNAIFQIAADKPQMAEARVQFTEANTDDANVFFGFSSAIAANTLVDNGAGMVTSFSGACIYKVDGSTVWKCVSSIGTNQTISTSTKAAGGSAYQTLRVEIQPIDSTTAEVKFFVDEQILIDATTNKPIKHVITYTGAAAMYVGAGVKNGDTNLETLNIDYIAVEQLRGL